MSTILADRLCAAAISYMGTVLQARDLANNMAMWPASTPDLEAQTFIELKRRVSNRWATCGDVEKCARVLSRTFRRWHASNSTEARA
jgi:hypothetical protein